MIEEGGRQRYGSSSKEIILDETTFRGISDEGTKDIQAQIEHRKPTGLICNPPLEFFAIPFDVAQS